ncbi:alpha/beta fold hydrolase [Pseudonocardia benzenivorans]|uniref:Alpha/beta fold hydrolase n=1 Tax=Pseudonocardia benzenivorans TaxID=228005 RepID=A0ABW3VSD5_9PSEU
MTGARDGRVADRVADLTVDGHTLHVAVRPAGGSGRTPLLLVNGIGAALGLLDPFVDALPPDVETIRFDPPGVGGSPAPVLPYHLPGLAAAVDGLLSRLGRGRVDVLGYSWGGALAQQLALGSPGRVRRLVLVATGTGALMVPGPPSVLARMLTGRRYHDPEHAREVAGRIYGGTMRTRPERAAEVLGSGRTTGPGDRGYRFQLLAAASWTSLPFLPLLHVPTLVVAGEDDPVVPVVNARILHRGIAGSQLHLHPGGHLALLTEPHELAPVVDAFLAAPDDPGAARAG